MKGNNLKDIAGQLKGLETLFKELPKIMEKALEGLSEEEKKLAETFRAEGNKIANNSNLDFGQKILKLQELKNKYGNGNNNK